MFSNKITLSNSHVNKNKKMKNISIINSLQDIEGLHIENLTTFNNYLEHNNLGVFLIYRQVDILKRPLFGEEIKLTTYPYNTTSISGYRHIFIKNDKNELLVTTNSYGVFVDLDSYKPVRIPKDIYTSLDDGIQNENMECLPRKIIYDEERLTYVNTVNIRKSHIDRYNHVNNAYYIDFALDNIDDEYEFNRIRVEYKKSLKLEDSAKIYSYINESNQYITVIKNNNDEITSIIEFSKVIFDI